MCQIQEEERADDLLYRIKFENIPNIFQIILNLN